MRSQDGRGSSIALSGAYLSAMRLALPPSLALGLLATAPAVGQGKRAHAGSGGARQSHQGLFTRWAG